MFILTPAHNVASHLELDLMGSLGLKILECLECAPVSRNPTHPERFVFWFHPHQGVDPNDLPRNSR